MSVQIERIPFHPDTRPTALLDRPAFSPAALRAKRLIDIGVAATLLVMAVPFLVLIAIAVALTSPGPVLFRQSRVGRDGTQFTMLKFRTMGHGTHDRVRSDPALWQLYVDNDYKLPQSHAEVTRIGSWLRRSSLDELPQLVNVMRGEMSVVGVRPIEMVQFVTRAEHSRQMYVALAPGLTGRWQVDGRSTVHHQARVQLDDSYVETWSLATDFALFLRTPWALVKHNVRR